MSDLTRAKILIELRSDVRIPAFPAVLKQIQAEFDKGADADLNHIADLVEQDVGLAAHFLRVAYSPIYPQVESGVSVRQAVQRIGLREAHQLSLAAGLTTSFAHTETANIFWRHCVATGLATRVLLELGNPDMHKLTDSAFAAGLLHDIGALVLAILHPDDVAEVLSPEVNIEGEVHLVERERASWGIDHAQVGRVVARKWGFPEELCSAIAHHHEPWDAPEEHRDLVLVVHLADFIASAYGLQSDFQANLELPDADVWDTIGVSYDDVDEILSRVRQLEEKAGAWVG